MSKLNFIAAAVLAASSLSANALTRDLGTMDPTGPDSNSLSVKYKTLTTFSDSWIFTIGAPSDVSFGAQSSFTALANQIQNFSGVLTGYGALTKTVDVVKNQVNLGWSGQLAAGDYEVVITGKTLVSNTSYTGQVVTTPVPEPTTYALLLGGLGVVGFVARRRKAA
ncbi:FxDxF family PEP-CTERM protein [Paucibacter sp. TC2R-5]|uniref:FxDxF family PEP-CTERM protein n=1 Tax=Paucibacter sp. TC2R-5 TaxID=2893555 RepID=UPI0021E3BB39|nr:FxDxF family PEP-CTERM protein [Paucibacter sp. TC2R-5]MCV2361543.1 FxDxF family PEP-CTERM protein [Paucibacter sp. TC2R-5]